MKASRMFTRILSGLLAVSMLTVIAGCNKGDSAKNSSTGSSSSSAAADSGKPKFTKAGSNGSRTDDEVGFQFAPPEKGEEIAVLHTNMGDIRVRLFEKSAPLAVTNFKALINKGYYNGLIFHRVIKDFMIQGGDPKGNGTGGESIWGEGFEYEFNKNLLHFTGALSMAHSNQPNSNGSQFFIVQGSKITEDALKSQGIDSKMSDASKNLYYEHGGTPWLDGQTNPSGHTVFGQVFDGMDVVNNIAAVQTGANDKPVTDVVITSAELVKYEG